MFKKLFALMCLIAFIGCNETTIAQKTNKVNAAENPIKTHNLVCLKVDKVNKNGFTGEPEYVVFWMFNDEGQEGSTFDIWTVKPSSKNFNMMIIMKEYYRYKIITKHQNGNNEIISIEEIGRISDGK